MKTNYEKYEIGYFISLYPRKFEEELSKEVLKESLKNDIVNKYWLYYKYKAIEALYKEPNEAVRLKIKDKILEGEYYQAAHKIFEEEMCNGY